MEGDDRSVHEVMRQEVIVTVRNVDRHNRVLYIEDSGEKGPEIIWT